MITNFPAPWRIVELLNGFAVEDATGRQIRVLYGRAPDSAGHTGIMTNGCPLGNGTSSGFRSIGRKTIGQKNPLGAQFPVLSRSGEKNPLGAQLAATSPRT
jgi:hypothetical protein